MYALLASEQLIPNLAPDVVTPECEWRFSACVTDFDGF